VVVEQAVETDEGVPGTEGDDPGHNEREPRERIGSNGDDSERSEDSSTYHPPDSHRDRLQQPDLVIRHYTALDGAVLVCSEQQDSRPDHRYRRPGVEKPAEIEFLLRRRQIRVARVVVRVARS
jgi:hypothetical protein